MATATATALTDSAILQTWCDWERTEWIRPILPTWLEMGHRERMAFFTGMVLPERWGKPGEQVTLDRVLGLSLVSRFPEAKK